MKLEKNLSIPQERMFKKIVLVLLGGWVILIGACHPYQKKKDNQSADPKKYPVESKIFLVGDLNKDQIQDTAFIHSKNSQGNELEMEENLQAITINFSGNISALTIEGSLGVYISKTEDLNQDNANELLVFSRTHEGWWNALYVFSYREDKWSKMAETQAFVSEPQDFEHRIMRKNGPYYLLGDNKWEEEENGHFKKIEVKIPNRY